MRPIKFRFWIEHLKTFEYFGFNDLEFLMQVADTYDAMSGKEAMNNDKLMQYTGLKDKNGKEIYEGDKIKGSGSVIREVAFDRGVFVGQLMKQDCSTIGGYSIPLFQLEHFEVIGNIYEGTNEK